MSEPRLSKELYCMILARMAALRGTCVRRTVGCVLTNESHHVLSTGYNGTKQREDHCIDFPCLGATHSPGNTLHCKAIHAERNAVDHCHDIGEVAFAFCTDSPCYDCAQYMTLYLPILKQVTYAREYADKRGLEILSKRGVVLCHDPKVFALSLDDLVQRYERQRSHSPSSDSKTTG